MKSFNNYNNSLISLEEDNSYQQKQPKQKYRNINELNNSSSDSFFSKIINSVSKIGQGLKNIMSMKINIENEDDSNKNVYDQVSNRFNTNEEISLIEAPSFMDDSYKYKINMKKIKDRSIDENNNYNNEINNISNENNRMIISHNETKRYDDDNNNEKDLESLSDSIMKKDEKNNNEIIFLKSNKKKVEIKSSLLSKKREREQYNSIEEEKNIDKKELNNDELNLNREEINKEKEKEKSVIKSENKSKMNDISGNSISEQKKGINSSIMSLSMKSLDNIKSEIEQRRIENLKSIEEMHKRHGLYYDYNKERKIRERILDNYYKEKEKRIAEGKSQMEKEKKKREEDFKKLKTIKPFRFKLPSIDKKPKIYTEIKNNQIQFIGQHPQNISVNTSNNLNVTFGNGSNNSGQSNQSNENKVDNNKKEIKSIFNNNENESNKVQIKSLFGSDNNNIIVNNNKENDNNQKNIFDNKTKSIFSGLMGNNKNTNESKIQEKKEEKKEEKKPSLFGNTQSLFGIQGTTSTINNPPLFGDINQKVINTSNLDNKKEENIFSNNKDNQRLFNPTLNSENKNNDIFGIKNNTKNNQSIFFSPSPSNINQNKQIFNKPPEKGGLFDQQTPISSSINNNLLFTSNKSDDKEQNKDQNKDRGSLLNKDNPFLSKANIGINSSNNFGNTQSSNNQGNPQTKSLFGNKGEGTSLFSFGNNQKSLFG